MSPLVAPSLLSANFLDLGKDVEMLNRSEADWLHLDVMDGVFVPNISFGFPIIEKVRKATSKPLDVHLMIVEPERYVERFRKAGADIITVHAEACKDLPGILKLIRSTGASPGAVISPDTPVEAVFGAAQWADLILIMSVYPGFGGQSFIGKSLDKIVALKRFLLQEQLPALIEIDGGVDLLNARSLTRAGVDILVAGNTIFASDDPAGTIRQLKNSA